ncbi:MAG: hypothetical protein ABEJ40_04555 [Haloarculaceae archaeon]
MKRTSLALLVGLLVVASGCLGGPSAGTGTPPETTPDGTPTPTASTEPEPSTGTSTAPTEPAPGSGTPTGAPVSGYEVHVFDHWETGSAAIEGGIAYETSGEYATRFYATTVATAGEAERFNHSVLRPAASAFVRNTSFEEASLVVIQAFPASSHPDYRVESVRRDGGTLRVAINDSSFGGTADVTVETVLLRVPGDAPERVAVTTEEGRTFDSSAGVVTVTETPTPTPTPHPFAGLNVTTVADPGDLRVENDGNETNGYRVSVTYRYEPPCRDATPPCGMPTVVVDVADERGKLRAGANRTIADVAPYRGNYTVTVTAELPGENGSRRSVSRTFAWNVTGSGAEATVTITDDGVSFSAG